MDSFMKSNKMYEKRESVHVTRTYYGFTKFHAQRAGQYFCRFSKKTLNCVSRNQIFLLLNFESLFRMTRNQASHLKRVMQCCHQLRLRIILYRKLDS